MKDRKDMNGSKAEQMKAVLQHAKGIPLGQAGPCLAGVFQPIARQQKLKKTFEFRKNPMGWKMFLPYKWQLRCRPARTLE